MKSEMKRNQFFFLSSISFLLMSSTLLVMPFADAWESGLRIVGAAFWFFLMIGFLFNFLSDRAQKAYQQQLPEKTEKTGGRPGLFTFFSNIPAAICDVVLFIGIFTAVFTGLFRPALMTTYAAYVLLFFIALSFCMHCLFNGRKYRLIGKSVHVRCRRNYAKK